MSCLYTVEVDGRTNFQLFVYSCWSNRMAASVFFPFQCFGNESNDTSVLVLLVMSHSLLWRHIVLLPVGVYSSKHGVLYTIEISVTRRFKKKSVGPSVRLSVSSFVTLTKKSTLLLHY